MTTEYREATPDDRDAILALRRRCFSDVDPEKLDPRFWNWEFSRARMFIAEQDGAVISHLAFVPWGELTIAVDAMTAPEARGSGVYTKVIALAMKTLGSAELQAYQIRDAVLGPMLKAGWAVAEKIPVLVRPALTFGKPSWRSLTRADASAMAAIARTKEFIEWRFFDNPRWEYRVFGHGEPLAGWIVTRRTTLKGWDTLAIVDLAGDVNPLIRDAVRDAKAMGCRLAAAFVSRAHPARAALLRRWFLPGPHRFRLLVKGTVRPWPVTWADTDHL